MRDYGVIPVPFFEVDPNIYGPLRCGACDAKAGL